MLTSLLRIDRDQPPSADRSVSNDYPTRRYGGAEKAEKVRQALDVRQLAGLITRLTMMTRRSLKV